MMRHYELAPIGHGREPLVFDWDDETGALRGPGADTIADMATWGTVDLHPTPAVHELGADPLRSKEDMAAIVGAYWQCPDDLAPFYPTVPDEQTESDFPLTY